MNEPDVTRTRTTASRRGFLGASAAGVIALAAGCSSGDSDAGAAAVASAEPVAFEQTDLSNAGGVLGWEGIAVIGGGQSNKLWIVDARSHKIVTAITNEGPFAERTDPDKYPNLRDAHAMTFTKDFKRMFTVVGFNYETSTVIEYDPITLRVVNQCDAGTGSHHLALSPDDRFLYAANQYGDDISVIDTTTMTKVTSIPVGGAPDYISPSMYWDGKAIDTPYLFVTVDGGKTCTVLDWKTNTVVKQIPLPGAAHGVNLTPDGSKVWLAGLAFKEVWIIDVATLEVEKKLPIPGSPIHISISPDNQFAYITTNEDLIYKVNTSNYQTLWSAKGTVIPAHTGLSPDGKELWTLNHGMDTTRYPFLLGGQPVEGVQVWDTETGKLTVEIPMEAMPHEIQFVPYATFGTPAPSADITNGT